VGDLLRATRRHPWRPAHLHFKIEAPGYEPLITHVFREGDQWLDSDAVFAVRQSLVAPWTQQADGRWRLDFDFVLNPLAQPAAQAA
jgi:hydroxyquinol 1,2-dioxygenase